tara:strand:- start:2461 stop:7887 length:5427 start_codon:yes stop_codon:yes gene_type:complete
MPELKRNFARGKMNKDLDERLVPDGEYRDALNVEVFTSEGSDVGSLQTIKGNTALTNLFGSGSTCVGNIVDNKNDKLYWLVSSTDINSDASISYTHESISVVNSVYSDYIMEFDEATSKYNYVVVEHYKVTTNATTISEFQKEDSQNIVSISDLNNASEFIYTGLQVGMVMTHTSGTVTQIRTIIGITYSSPEWKLELDSILDFNILPGDELTFELPTIKRALGFSHFAASKPQKLITGINIIDDLLFWTDGLTEPKKINIQRCKYGSQQAKPATYPNGTRQFPTLLIVNGDKPTSANGRIDTTIETNGISIPLTYRETTVIKKSPTTPLQLIMSNNTTGDINNDLKSIVEVNIDLAPGLNTSDFFFVSNTSDLLSHGDPTPSLPIGVQMDWKVTDVIEFFPNDDDAGNSNDLLVTARVSTVANNDTFTFEIISISNTVSKVFTTFKAKLKQEDPLFEFVFPRFAYRWKYEDGEYSCYSPFSDVAFLPDEFDYLPKKGHNLGMTNNLRSLVLAGFKPTCTPLDVVEVDILYKESNSPNVYTVETIKSPSTRNNLLNTTTHDGDQGWFGKLKYQGSFVETPNTQSTSLQPVALSNVNPTVNNDYFKLEDKFGDINIKVGDQIEGTGLSGTVLINDIDVINGDIFIKITAGGSIVTADLSVVNPTLLTFKRTLTVIPAIQQDYPQGSIRVKTDMIHAAVPANQLLRPFDNVPINALSQEVTGNRIIYGNYTQNYDLYNSQNDTHIKNTIEVSLTKRLNIIENVRFDINTTLRSQEGTTVDWFNQLNAIVEETAMPERSLKSLRDYQVGVVYMDEYGRQTPIQTHEDAVLKIKKEDAENYNAFRMHLWKDFVNGTNARFPDWATYYKYYIKEPSNEYYNLAMDRFYGAEDGNVWLSFPSSERNKVDEETFIILKKQHDSDTFVRDEARYKILAISNEVPLFIKTKTDSYGIKSTTFITTGEPRFQAQHVDVSNSVFDNGGFGDFLTQNEKFIRIHSANNVSYYYEVLSITNLGAFRRITLRESFGADVSFTTNDGTNGGNLIPGLSLEAATKKVKNLPEFEGRFFVKVLKDGVLEENIIGKAASKTYVTTQNLKLGRAGNIPDDPNYWKDYNGVDNFGGKWWATEESPKDHENWSWPVNNWTDPLEGVKDNHIDMQIHWGGGGLVRWEWGLTRQGNAFGASAADLDRAKKARTIGQLFRWKGDTTIYKVTHAHPEFQMANYSDGPAVQFGNSAGNSDDASNHSVGIRLQFTPALNAAAGTLDAVGLPHSGYDPRTENTEGSTAAATTYGQITTDTWSGENNINWLNNTSNARYHRTIEFIEEFIEDSSYSSDNPAIWETEPKENVDIDIYHEASQAYPISREFNPYLNKFIKHTFSGSYNATNYYNCFSFANGVESNRIRDDFNAVTIDKGPKVSTVLAEQYKQENRKSGLIFSGIYNSTSGINRLNQFIQAEKITKDLNPTYGSIQKLYSRNSDLIALCEDKILQIYANKDALFNADGNVNLTASDRVLGDVRPFVGEYGISTNPESFASESYRSYFTDKSRGAVIRLSKDGLTPISEHGMTDFFRDTLNLKLPALIGSYDQSKNAYNLSIPSVQAETIRIDLDGSSGDTPLRVETTTPAYSGNTISFSEKNRGWTSFKSWVQECGCSLNDKYFTFKGAEIYQHHFNETRNNFYGTQYESSVCLIFNDMPSSVKSFSSLSYEGSKSKIVQDVSTDAGGNSVDGEYYNNATVTGWYTDSITTDLETGFIPEFKDKEGKWFNYIHGDKENTLANLDTSQFSTQGIGSPSGVNSDTAQVSNKTFTVSDRGDTP